MDVNPYTAPQAPVEDVGIFSPADLEARKASRAVRLGAAMLDGIIIMVCCVPVFIAYAAVAGNTARNSAGSAGLVVGGVLSLALILGLFALNCVLLHRNGQTLGKRIAGIKVVRTDGSRISLGRYVGLRILPINLLGQIPGLGALLSLVDCLLIFGAERRCLHDIFADTIVVNR